MTALYCTSGNGMLLSKLLTSDPATRYHPSTRTKKIILNGNEIMTGGNIIIPIAIKIDAVTMSIIKNGRNNINPISKARRNSEIIKAGITT